MPRAIWTGAISFGLVHVPVRLVTAVREEKVDFHMLQEGTGQRIHYLNVNDDGEQVPREEIVKGYELDTGDYVVVEPEELDALAPEKSETIEIERFVALEEIDPIYYDRPYYLLPEEKAEKPYALLLRALEKSGSVGIARFVMHQREHLTALRSLNGVLCLVMMRFAEDVVPTEELGLDLKGVSVKDAELKVAVQLIEAMSGEFDPTEYTSEYRDRVRALLQAKAEGKEVVRPEPREEPVEVENLVEALKESLKQAQKS